MVLSQESRYNQYFFWKFYGHTHLLWMFHNKLDKITRLLVVPLLFIAAVCFAAEPDSGEERIVTLLFTNDVESAYDPIQAYWLDDVDMIGGIAEMTHYTAAGDPSLVRRYLENFAEEARVDEVITVHPSRTLEQRLRSIDLLADVFEGAAV